MPSGHQQKVAAAEISDELDLCQGKGESEVRSQ